MTDQPEVRDCGRSKPHPAHRFMLGRKVRQCSGRVQPEPASAEANPTPRTLALDATKQAINALGMWLPPAGREAVVDAVLALVGRDACCVCGGGQVVYRNYRDQPFCQRCADGKTPACTHCGGDGYDPEDPGDYDPAVHQHNPGTRQPCPECVQRGRPPRLDITPFRQPAEHCGHQLPSLIDDRPMTECALRPGHQGSHANNEGARWQLAAWAEAHAGHGSPCETCPDGSCASPATAPAAGSCLHCGRGDVAPTADQYEQQRKRAERAEAALAALHDGEEGPVDEHIQPTPAQWIWQWNRATTEQRLDMAGRIRQAFDEASRCHLQRHAGRVAEGRVDRATLGRVRTELDRWALNTGTPQTIRALEDIYRALESPKEQP